MDREVHQEIVFIGPFLTRDEVPAVEGDPAPVLALGGPLALEEVYPAFQFHDGHVRSDVAEVAEHLLGSVDQWTACGWFASPRSDLGGRTPLQWLDEGGRIDPLLSGVRRRTRRAPSPG